MAAFPKLYIAAARRSWIFLALDVLIECMGENGLVGAGVSLVVTLLLEPAVQWARYRLTAATATLEYLNEEIR